MEKRTYGYVRVSSRDQNEERQVKAMIDYGVDERSIFIDKESGATFERQEYQKLKHFLRKGDLLVIMSIDRLGRNYELITDEWKSLTKDIGVDIVVLDMPLLDTTKNKDTLGSFMSDLVLQILSFVAEQERTQIKTRQKQGIANAKQKGVAFGRPKVQQPENFEQIYDTWKNGEITAKQAMIELNLKPNTFYKFAKEFQNATK
ncbi:recombinase family protein [Erysipelothrix aquatica]|uniref:recombinase family protein n=1 Tax=Erysipelothrix aquatica TaxID=2683714 RepID=UPI0013594CE6|nr:recombinase family protein [Erysipelothrix aquatica]